MSKRLVKCYGTCEQKYPQDEMTKFKGQNHCKSCYEAKVKEVNDREDLYKYLQEVFKISYPTGLMLRQIKQFKEDRGYSYKNIRFAVDYIIRIKRTNLQLKYGIALVPHIYDEMISYYKELKEKRDNTVIQKPKTVTIKKTPVIYENTYREKKMINMERLLEENDSES